MTEIETETETESEPDPGHDPVSPIHDRVLATLDAVDRPGICCTCGDVPMTMPGLWVDGLGDVRLPLGGTTARKLIARCRQAPYGKGTETMVDTEVRRAWELDPHQFRLTNPQWGGVVESVLEVVKIELGLEDRRLAAQIYKLLVYEEGGFFLPHRDGERLDRMVATLTISLPSVHQGGEIVVRHDGREHELTFGAAAAGTGLSYAAFYADCEHEVRPLRQGYRLCLTYNVTLAKARGKQGLAAPSFGDAAVALNYVLADWIDAGLTRKLAVALEHRYTQEGLTVDALKGADRARADVLFEAAKHANCVAHLALVTLWEQGSAEGDYDPEAYRYGSGSRRSWSYDEDDEDLEEEAGGIDTDYRMGEVFDQSLTATHWIDEDGSKVGFGALALDEDELVIADPLRESVPSRQEYEGYTGNAGMTLDRWYHRAAIVLWSREDHFTVLCDAGTGAAVTGFAAKVRRLKRLSRAQCETERQECLEFADAIMDTWDPRRHFSEGASVDRSRFPEILAELDAPELLRRFLSEVLVVDGDVQLSPSVLRCCRKHGWSGFADGLTAVIDAATKDTVRRNAALLRMLCAYRDKNVQRRELCVALCARATAALVAFDGSDVPAWQLRGLDRAELLEMLVAAMLAADAQEALGCLVEHALSDLSKYDLTDAHLAAIFALQPRLMKAAGEVPAVGRWLGACREALELRTARAPRQPVDFSRQSELPCRCRDCAALSGFLADPVASEIRLPINEARRLHLRGVIAAARCDVKHVTERRGSPYVLVCTKTTASYDAVRREYERDRRNLAQLEGVAARVEVDRGRRQRQP